MNNYILSYNPFGSVPTHGQILNHVQISRYISAYYQPFPGTYVIKSDQSAVFLTDVLKGLFESTPYMVSQVWPEAMGGTLPQDIWHWVIHGFIPETSASSAAAGASNNALGSLLSKGGIGSEHRG